MCIDTAYFACVDLQRSFRATTALHWEDSDTVTQEVFSNVRCFPHNDADDADLFVQESLTCICIAFAVQTY
jgi:hypothetical protein